MKIAKKVLSVLLAVAMILSTVAVAASAVGSPTTSKYQTKFTLKAQEVTFTSLNKMSGKATGFAVGDTESAGTVNVEAGKYYRINFYPKTNYCVGYTEGVVYFDGKLLDAKEIYTALGNSKGIDTSFYGMNADNGWIAYAVDGSAISGLTLGSNMDASAKKTGAFDAIKNADGSNYFKDGDDTKIDIIKWLIAPNAGAQAAFTSKLGDSAEDAFISSPDGMEVPYDTTNEALFYFTVQVPATAKAGDEFKIYIPQESRKDANGNGILTFGAAGDYECSSNDLQTKAVLGEDQYFDLSDAVLTLKIPGGTTISRDGLQEAYDTYKDTVLDNYKDSTEKTNFSNALAAAADELTNQALTSQEAIDAITTAITDNFGKLVLKDIDKSALGTLIEECDKCTLDDYVNDANWTTFQSKLTDAKSVYNNAELTTILQQATVDTAKSNLETAKGNLNALSGANYQALNALIDAFEKLTSTNYTSVSWGSANTAYLAAKEVPTNLKSNNQKTIDDAATALDNAIKALVEADANYTTLENLYNAVKDYVQGDYASGWSAFAGALDTAKGLLDNKNLKAKDQKTVDDAYTALNNAKEGLVPYGKANYTDLQNAVNDKPTYYAQADAYYNNWADYANALETANGLLANQNLNASQQATIDNAKNAVISTKGALTLKDADYTAVTNALSGVPANLDENYTAETVSVLKNAINAVQQGKKINEQETVTGYATAIVNATKDLVLKPADLTELNKAITADEKLKAEYYTTESFNAFTEVLNAAKELAKKTDLTFKDNQGQVDQMVINLDNAVKALVSLGADYNGLKTQVEAFEALTPAHYTAASYATVKAVYLSSNAVYATRISNPYTKEQQSVVDNAATALEEAMKDLVEADAVYTTLNAYIDDAAEMLDAENIWQYDDTYLGQLSAAKLTADGVDKDLKVKDQKTIDDAAEALKALVEAPVYSAYDYTTLNGLKATWLGMAANEDNYTKASWKIVKDAYDALVWNYTNEPTQYGKAQKQDGDFNTILSTALVTAGLADYSAVEAQKAEAAKLNENDYTKASWGKLTLALNNANTYNNYNSNHQDEVDALATAIETAIANLIMLADFTDLNAKIDEVDGWLKTATQSNYTVDSLGAVNTKLAAAKALQTEEITADEQNQVDTALSELTIAFAGLTLKTANFTELQAEIAKLAQKDSNKYTSASWQAYVEAVNAGQKAIDDKYDITKQGEVDALKAAIVKAESGLSEKQVSGEGVFEAPTGTVKEVYTVNDFTFRINKRAAKIQFIDADGNTWTYTRQDSRASIVSYDDEGNKLESDLSVALSYEDWTISQFLPKGVYTVRAKYGGTWDDVNTSTMTIQPAEPTNIELYSCELAATEGNWGHVALTLVAGSDVQRIQVVNATGSTTTSGVTSSEGNKNTFVTHASIYGLGKSVIHVRAYYADEWHDDFATVTYNCTSMK